MDPRNLLSKCQQKNSIVGNCDFPTFFMISTLSFATEAKPGDAHGVPVLRQVKAKKDDMLNNRSSMTNCESYTAQLVPSGNDVVRVYKNKV